MAESRPDLDFKLSITRALADQLDAALRRCLPAPLTDAALERIEKRSGIYELTLDGRLVYVGKASKNLQERLGQHLRKISGRQRLQGTDIRFVCLYVDEDLEASAPEKLLIKRYRIREEAPWNTNGFGNKDPGRQRDTSAVALNHFDAVYPIDLDLGVTLTSGETTVAALLAELKRVLPYLLRFQNPKKHREAREVYEAARALVPDAILSARDAIALVVSALPADWQATALPGYVILYPENPKEYGSATHYWRSTDGGVQESDGPRQLGPPKEVPEDPIPEGASDDEPSDDE